ncbi:MAG: HEAT repeat domain-containing protein, partial [Acidobacteriota bacterium]|nr:HEAT repeat domain-containing protein [Acidobacteriota bacterium]
KRLRGFLSLLICCLLAAIPASAQELTARFYPQKSVYLLGEPVWFVFEVKNKGNTLVHLEYSDPFGVCAIAGGYAFDVAGAADVGRWRCGFVASCAGGGSTPLAAGATYRQRLLLNQWFLIGHAGKYRVSASRSLRFGSRADRFTILAPAKRTFKSQFEITVVEGEKARVERAFDPFLKNLSTRDFDLRVEAVETITAMATPFLEKTLIALATGEDSFAQSRAIPALGRLNTAESRRVLAKLIADRQPYYIWQAIDALAPTGDRTYVPLLAQLAREPKWQNVAIPALGELGGRDVIPLLLPFIHYPLGPPSEPPVQSLAIRGLANTSSREAVPYLIEALRNPLVHRDAVNALEQITHWVIRDGKTGKWLYTEDEETADRMARRWQRWWESMNHNAKLYGPGDCTRSPGELPEE